MGVEFLIKYDPYCVELSCLRVAAEADVAVRVHLCELGNRKQFSSMLTNVLCSFVQMLTFDP